MHLFRLVPFEISAISLSDIPPALDIAITGTLALGADVVNIDYRLSGATERVKYGPVHASPSRKNELWRTTCFELFIKTPDGPEYWEYNLGPSGDWNVYRFTGYRSALQQEPLVASISIETEIAQTRLVSLQATLALPPRLVGQKLAIGISSVIEDTAGGLHYFALRHGGLKPDFHDPAGFVLSLDPAPV